MQFHTDGKLYKIVSTTGPTHNFLGLEFADAKIEPVEVKATIINGEAIYNLLEEDIKKYVIIGVDNANKSFSSSYCIKKIVFVPSDSPPAEIYERLSYLIIERLCEFKDAGYNGSNSKGVS